METDSSQNIDPPNRAAIDPTYLQKILKLRKSPLLLRRLIMAISVNLKFKIRNLFEHLGFVISDLFGISWLGFRVFIIDYVV